METTFLKSNSIKVAPKLLGWILCRQLPHGLVKVRIVETEAYHQADPASHSFRGMTARTAPMFEAGGTIYVYFTYGMHYCLNIVTGKKEVGEAVLLRAAEPLEGIEIMHQNRFNDTVLGLTYHSMKSTNFYDLANGPAKLTQALNIKDTLLSGKKLGPQTLFLEPPQKMILAKDIIASPRIGIREATEMPWRFYIKDNPFVSRNN